MRLPSVASKSFLITIGDRSVGGMVVQEQMVGPWQVPVADCAVTLRSFDSIAGEAMAVGERTPLAVTDAAASARMAVGEVITNLAGAAIAALADIKLSANWMAAAGRGDEDQKLFDAVKAVGMELCPALGLTIPVGKDSMSMAMRWRGDGEEKSVIAPLSLVVSGFAPVTNVRRTLTPQLQDRDTVLLLVDLGAGRNRLGGSALAQVYGLDGGAVPDVDDPARLKAFFDVMQTLGPVLYAYHDRSDGGLFTTLVEMAFAGCKGLDIDLGMLDGDDLAALFNEELGAVIQIAASEELAVASAIRDAGLVVHAVGRPTTDETVTIRRGDETIYQSNRADLQRLWAETSYRIQSLRDNPECARQEFEQIGAATPGLHVKTGFALDERVAAPFFNKFRPRVAILREQGVNGQTEMAAAFDRAGFTSVDVHMSDLLAGRIDLKDFIGLAACGGFSYGDVLGAGSGWAKTVLFNTRLREMFAVFFARPDTFSLGVCNGCQMMAQLKDLIPGAASWPRFTRNISARFEARLCQVEIPETPAVLFAGMAGSRMPVPVAHGEGHVGAAAPNIALRYLGGDGKPTMTYPLNPSGSAGATAGVCSDDGRALIVMPHPERAFLGAAHTWTRELKDSPWQRMFDNARVWVG